MPESEPAEAAVRLYLLYLEDPSNLVDQAAVSKAEKAVDAANDPLDKLQALAELDRATPSGWGAAHSGLHYSRQGLR